MGKKQNYTAEVLHMSLLTLGNKMAETVPYVVRKTTEKLNAYTMRRYRCNIKMREQ